LMNDVHLKITHCKHIYIEFHNHRWEEFKRGEN